MKVYFFTFVALLLIELLYFKVADKCNIIDKPNQRSSHTKIVLRGGGIIFTIALWIWSLWYGFQYPWLLAGVTIAAGISFIDDIHSLPDSLRMVVQFASMFLVFQEMGLLHWEMWWIIPIALFFAIGGTNIINFMDGINGITAAYSLAMLIPIYLINDSWLRGHGLAFVEPSYLIVAIIGVLVFSVFNFRPRGKAKCFAGDVGSIGIAFIILFALGRLMLATGDLSWIVLFILYGADGTLTIVHRIMLHENLGQAHRKHAFQLMANELKISHPVVSLIYMGIQMVISLAAIYLIPNSSTAHWLFFISVGIVLVLAYILFMKKYYHLHEEYLRSLQHN